jgi:PKD repeat protein
MLLSARPSMVTSARRRFTVLLVALAAALVSVPAVTATPARAADATPQMYTGPAFPATGATSPTEDKPQSKLWYNDGAWWALMRSATQGVTIHRLQADHTWLNTGTVVDSRAASTGDALWDGSKLYVASRVASGNVLAARFSYNASTDRYSKDFSKNLTSGSIESVTIAKDSLNRLWVTFTKPDTSNTSLDRVYVAHSTTSDTTWTAPFLVPVSDNTIKGDDISAVVAFSGKIGVLYSDQQSQKVHFAVHPDGSADNAGWTLETALSGTRYADDHLNVKSLLEDDQGRVYAAIKTSRGDASSDAPSDPSVAVLSRSSTGTWTPTTAAVVSEGLTRPQLALDKTNKQLYVVMTTEGGGKVYYRHAPFGTSMAWTGSKAVMMSASGALINNATTAKDAVTSQTGLVVLAADEKNTRRYYHAELSLGGDTPAPTPAPTASFTATPTSGTAPLAVQFTDTSTGSPTSWSWDFGDGTSSTAQNPSHTYSAAGTFSVTLTATNASGSDASSATTITVTAPGGGDGGGGATISEVGSTATGNSAAVTSVPIQVPSGVQAGDFLIAQITADNNPTATAPSGWTQVTSPVSAGTGARVFAFYHRVAAGETTTPTFTLSSAQKYNAVMSAFRGVDATTPFDTAATTKVNTNTGVATLALPSVTTVTPGALLVGGVGANSGGASVTPPSGWTESEEATVIQLSETAFQARPTAGATGTQTWTFSKGVGSAGWMRALRPA